MRASRHERGAKDGADMGPGEREGGTMDQEAEEAPGDGLKTATRERTAGAGMALARTETGSEAERREPPAVRPQPESAVHLATNGWVSAKDGGRVRGRPGRSAALAGAEAETGGDGPRAPPTVSGSKIATRSCRRSKRKVHKEQKLKLKVCDEAERFLSQPQSGRCLLPCQIQQRAGRLH